jgi:RimJ/RimL family protein N-acetyltransferase
MTFHFEPATGADAERIAAWHYRSPYHIYDWNGHTEGFRREADNYRVVKSNGVPIAFLCWGSEARVKGFTYDDSCVDIGWGLRPDLTGAGLGKQLITDAVRFVTTTVEAKRLRATVAGFNARCQRAAEHAGFSPAATFTRPTDGLAFVVVEKNC